VRGAFFAAGGLFGGLGSADNPVADCVAVDESAGAHEAADWAFLTLDISEWTCC